MSLIMLLICSYVLSGCHRIGRVHPDGSNILGEYVSQGGTHVFPLRYKELVIFSNNVFSCECLVRDKWIKVEGKWELDADINGADRITFSDVLDEIGKRMHLSLPIEVYDNGTVWIGINEDSDFVRTLRGQNAKGS
jgi:hypothetical protein